MSKPRRGQVQSAAQIVQQYVRGSLALVSPLTTTLGSFLLSSRNGLESQHQEGFPIRPASILLNRVLSKLHSCLDRVLQGAKCRVVLVVNWIV